MLASITAQNNYTIGRVKACLMVLFVSGVSYTYTDSTLAEVNGITLPPPAVLGADDWQVYKPIEGSEWTEGLNPGKNGLLYPQGLTLSFEGITVAQIKSLDTMCKRGVLVLVQDMDSRWWLLGKTKGLKGGRSARAAGYEVSLSGVQAEQVVAVSPSLVSTIAGGVYVPPAVGGSGEPVTILDSLGNLIETIQPGGTYTVPAITSIEGGSISEGDEQYTPANGIILGEPL